MLFAIVKSKGNPGEGKRKLSPLLARRYADIQMAILPPFCRKT
jgi:hypothetical protein